MRYYGTMVLAVILVGLFAGFAKADVVVLKGGQELIGDIVAERHEQIYVDVGVTVIAVPKEDVLEYHYDKAEEANDLAVKPQEGTRESGNLQVGCTTRANSRREQLNSVWRRWARRWSR